MRARNDDRSHVRLLVSVLVSTVLLGALAGCGGSTTKQPDAAGTELDGDGYSVNLPVGWRPVEPGPRGGFDTAGRDPRRVDGTTNRLRVRVVRLETEIDEAALEDFLRTVMRRVSRSMPKAEMLPPTELDGEVALRYSGLVRGEGTPYFSEQVAAGRGTELYTITFVFARSVSQKSRDARIDSVLRSWRWD